MKKVLFGISLLFLAFGATSVNAQVIGNNQNNAGSFEEFYENNNSNFYQKTITSTKKAQPYQHLRESDVIWETCIWRTIDFREKFNQFFYFPKGDQCDLGNQGRVNLAYLVYKTAGAGEFEVFEDDELKVPLDWADVDRKLNKADSTTTEPEYDEYGEMISEGHDTVIFTNFNSDDYYKIYLKEYWYIDKQDTRMKVRIIGLCLVDENCKTDKDGETDCNPQERFWIPMNNMQVRNIMARYNAYDMYNNSADRSYDEIFVTRFFDSFVTRETNVYNREIHDYVTGEDAILESQNIEERIFDIESDMWEY